MKRFFLAILMLIAPAVAMADWVARQDGIEIVLSTNACSREPILALATPQVREMLHDARITYKGKTLNACWAPVGSDAWVVFDDGDVVPIPGSQIKQLKAA